MICRVVSTDVRTIVCPIVQATLNSATQDFFVFAQIVSRGRVDVLMTSQVLDQGDVCPMVAKVGAECVP